MQDPYCYPDSCVLRNKFNIRDSNELCEAERRLSKYRAEELLRKPAIGKFDFKHLQKIHQYLFQDIYDWAGKVRTVDLAKGDIFCLCYAIDSESQRIFTELEQEKYLQGLSTGEFARRLAYYLAEINALHPFREGNGRTQREFIRQLTYQNNYLISYAGVSKDEMIGASVASLHLDYAPMERMILNCLRPC